MACDLILISLHVLFLLSVGILKVKLKPMFFLLNPLPGYALESVIITEFTKPRTVAERRFNCAFRTLRCSVEREIGKWKGLWGCLHKKRFGPLKYEPEKACAIIRVAAILYNFVKEEEGVGEDVYVPAVEDDEDPGDDQAAAVLGQEGGVARRALIVADFARASNLSTTTTTTTTNTATTTTTTTTTTSI